MTEPVQNVWEGESKECIKLQALSAVCNIKGLCHFGYHVSQGDILQRIRASVHTCRTAGSEFRETATSQEILNSYERSTEISAWAMRELNDELRMCSHFNTA